MPIGAGDHRHDHLARHLKQVRNQHRAHGNASRGHSRARGAGSNLKRAKVHPAGKARNHKSKTRHHRHPHLVPTRHRRAAKRHNHVRRHKHVTKITGHSHRKRHRGAARHRALVGHRRRARHLLTQHRDHARKQQRHQVSRKTHHAHRTGRNARAHHSQHRHGQRYRRHHVTRRR